MDIWLDTTNIQIIDKAARFGLLSGVTTNPSLVAQSNRDLEDLLKDLLHHQEGPVTAQVISEDVNEMVQQGKYLHSLSNRLIIKVPVTKSGLEAIHLLSRQGIPTMGTVVFHPRQALMASLAGANYVAPYLRRIEKVGENPWIVLQMIVDLFTNYKLETKILGASLQSVEQVLHCAQIGIYGVTVKDDLFEKLIETDKMTQEGVEQFAHDWQIVDSLGFGF